MVPESTWTHSIPETKLEHKTQQNYNRSNYKIFYKSVIIHNNRIFPYFQNKVKNLNNLIIITIIIIVIIIIIMILIIIIINNTTWDGMSGIQLSHWLKAWKLQKQ